MHSINGIEENIKKIGELFPEVITESIDKNGEIVHAIDFEKLKQLLSDSLIDERERYDFTWVGKNKAILEAGTPTNKTLRPQKDKSVDWDNTENVYIEGDNLEVLKLLQESYLNKIDVIYIDPPYNTGNDFIYDDDFKMSQEEYEEATGEFDEYKKRMKNSKKDSARFHSDWLSMMYSRLKLARNLLSDDGVIFISIDDNEQAHLKELCDEVFGEDNMIAQLIRRTINTGKQDTKKISVYHEYLLSYSKNSEFVRINKRIKSEEERKKLYPLSDQHINSRGRYYISQLDKGSLRYSDSLNYPIEAPDGSEIWPGDGFDDKSKIFRWSKEKVIWGIQNDFIEFKKKNNKWKVYAKSYEFRDNNNNEVTPSNPYTTLDFDNKQYSNFNATPELQQLMGGKIFNFPKPIIFLKDILRMSGTKNSTILDFFSGSGTTADAVMQLNAEDGGNRKFIMVQLPEEIDEKQEAYKEGYRYITEIGEERIRRAGTKVKEEHPEVDTGFRVFKVDSSNIENTYKSPDETNQNNLLADIRNVKPDRNDLDLLYQVMLDWGLELSLPYESEIIDETPIHNVFDGALIACFADDLNEKVIRSIAEKQPCRVVFKDSSFKDSAMKINVVEIFKELSPNTKIKVI